MATRILVSQASEDLIDLEHTEGDPVSFAFNLANDDGSALDWSGTYLPIQARHKASADSAVQFTATVTATVDGDETAFTFINTDLDESAAFVAGEYVWDCQLDGGVTRFGGRWFVMPQVTR